MEVAHRGRTAARPDGGASDPAVRAAELTGARHAAALRRGVIGAVLCALALGSLWAITVPAYWPVDEVSHVPYARAAASGQLPTIHTPISPDGLPGIAERLAYERAANNDDRQDVWTSNHPPLFFVLAGMPLLAGEAVGAPGLGFLGARGVSVLAAALGVALTAAVARVLLPGRPRVAVGAAAVAALVPTLSHFSGLVFNDSMSFALCTALTLFALLALRDGSDRWVVAAGVAGAGAALTRAAALPLVALAAVACAVGAWHAAPATASRVHRWMSAARAGGVAAVLPALASGWFYLRNWQRYGDITGSRALLAKFDRDPNAELDELVVDMGFYIRQWERLLGDLSTGIWAEGWRIPVIRALGAAILVGLAVAAVRWVRGRGVIGGQGGIADRVRRLRSGPGGSGWVEGRWRRWAWPLVLAFPAGLLFATARFHAEGGSAHARYLLSALAIIALVGAIGLDALDRRATGWPTLLGIATLVVIGLGVWTQFLEEAWREWKDDGRVYSMEQIGTGWTDPATVLLLVLLAGGLLLVARAIRDLPPAPDGARDGPGSAGMRERPASPLPGGDRPL